MVVVGGRCKGGGEGHGPLALSLEYVLPSRMDQQRNGSIVD